MTTTSPAVGVHRRADSTGGARDPARRVWFLGGIAVAIAVGILLSGTRGYQLRADETHYEGDLQHYVYWTRLVTLDGVQSAYDGTWPITYAVYPPVPLYAYLGLGLAYTHFVDPTFALDPALESDWLNAGLKTVAVFWHLLASAAIYGTLSRSSARSYAGIAAALYAANPAALFDIAYWGQPDGAQAFFTVAAIGAVSVHSLELGWGSIAAAALAKPQAWAVLPLLALGTWPLSHLKGIVWGAAVAAASSLVLVSPFLLTGHLPQLLTLPGAITSVMPVVTADAHNAWFLFLAARRMDVLTSLDTQHLFLIFSYREVALACVALFLLFSCWLYATRHTSLPEAAALATLSWFTFTTQAHENHLFLVLPLLALAWPDRRSLLILFALLTLTILLNMALQDQLLLETFSINASSRAIRVLRLGNACLNVLALCVWSVWAAIRSPEATSTEGSVNRGMERPPVVA